MLDRDGGTIMKVLAIAVELNSRRRLLLWIAK